ncbi:hypothetical protein [Mycobacteroides abscessus]|uniref:hypothetical protein n=1 Tax=Mycobacteroides abscessus TaxID=36809 RepID=UPI001877EA87
MDLSASAVEIVDLDQPAVQEVNECACGVRRTNLRSWELSPAPGRALARLREAHREEYEQYLRQERASALAVFEAKWSAHLAGDHGGCGG